MTKATTKEREIVCARNPREVGVRLVPRVKGWTQPTEKLVYDTHVEWPSLDEERQDEEPEVPDELALVEVSKETRRFLVDKCTRGVANEVRRRTRSCFPLPKVVAMKRPQLDPLMKA